jgi:hypothetical protein
MQGRAIILLGCAFLGQPGMHAAGWQFRAASQEKTKAARESVASAVTVTVERQSIVRGGPHRFREVYYKLANTGKKPVYVFGSMRGDRFEPAGDRVRPGEAGSRPPEQDALQESRTLGAGESLRFTRTYAPDDAGKRMKAAVYCSFSKNGPPMMVTTAEFLLE